MKIKSQWKRNNSDKGGESYLPYRFLLLAVLCCLLCVCINVWKIALGRVIYRLDSHWNNSRRLGAYWILNLVFYCATLQRVRFWFHLHQNQYSITTFTLGTYSNIHCLIKEESNPSSPSFMDPLASTDREAVAGSYVHGDFEESLHSGSFGHLCLINPLARGSPGAGSSAGLPQAQTLPGNTCDCAGLPLLEQPQIKSTSWPWLWPHRAAYPLTGFRCLGHLRCLCCPVGSCAVPAWWAVLSLCPACDLQRLAWGGCATSVGWERKALAWAPLISWGITVIPMQTHSLCSLHNLTSKGRKTFIPWQESPV